MNKALADSRLQSILDKYHDNFLMRAVPSSDTPAAQKESNSCSGNASFTEAFAYSSEHCCNRETPADKQSFRDSFRQE